MSICKIGLFCLAIATATCDAANEKTLNNLVEKTVENIRASYEGGGYDINSSFTHDLPYGESCCIKASNAKQTMCVAAVAEVIIDTINHRNEKSSFLKLPMSTWTKGTLTSARANLFMYKGTGSRGTGSALEKIGIGREKDFKDLVKFDFINFNRTNKSGHAAVFLGYLDMDSKVVSKYDDNIIGFSYYSAQGKGKPDAGFSDRYAYFDGNCPEKPSAVKRDCGVIRSKNRVLLSGGELWDPIEWKVEERTKSMISGVRSIIEGRFKGADKGLIDTQLDTELQRELPPASARFSGETTD